MKDKRSCIQADYDKRSYETSCPLSRSLAYWGMTNMSSCTREKSLGPDVIVGSSADVVAAK